MGKRSNKRLVSGGIYLLLAITLAACSSSGPTVPFIRPNADYSALSVPVVESVASELEQHVADEVREPSLDDRDGFVVDTPEVKQAMRSRAARYLLLQELLNSGHATEQMNGKVAILRSRAYSNDTNRRERDRHALIVISENRDRATIYESLQRANNLSPETRVAIEEIFSRERYSRLEPGQKYSNESGDAVPK